MHVTLDTIGILAICAAPAASALAAAVFTARLACRYTDHEIDRLNTALNHRIDTETTHRVEAIGTLSRRYRELLQRDATGNTGELDTHLDPIRPRVPIKPDHDLLTTDAHGTEPPYTPDTPDPVDPVEAHTRNIIQAIARQESMRPDRHG